MDVIWAMFFTSVCSMQEHPGVKVPKTMEECARIADLMFDEYLKRRDYVCRGLSVVQR